jgi:hypothetical protein
VTPDVKLDVNEVRCLIFSPQNRFISVWTASTLLALRCGVHVNTLKGELVEHFKPLRLRAGRSLHALWQQGLIYRHEELNAVGGWKEARYFRPSDARGVYFVACDQCGHARRSVNRARGRMLEECPGCRLAPGQVSAAGGSVDPEVNDMRTDRAVDDVPRK